MSTPLVSIIMPSFNTGAFIHESIESVLAQTYQHWELIIVDDCSTDDTDAVISSLPDSRIVYLKNSENFGAAVSRNRAIAQAKGKYIAFLDSDDLWTPEKLEKQVQFMEETGYVFTYHNYDWVDSSSNQLNVSVLGPKKITKKGFYLCNWVGCLSVMYNAEQVGLIQIEDLKKRNDYAYWLKISGNYECHLLDENLAHYRRREGSISGVSQWELVKSHYRLYRKGEKLSVLLSMMLTACNVVFVVYRKKRYVERMV